MLIYGNKCVTVCVVLVLEDLIHLISISDDGRFIVTADRMSNIAVWKDYKVGCHLPVSVVRKIKITLYYFRMLKN